MHDFRTRRRQWRFGVIAAATGGRQAPVCTGLLPVPGVRSFNFTIEVQQDLHVERLTN